MQKVDVVVVGAGLAGLGAATLLAREGLEVVLLEASAPGGRARSQQREGFTFNLGPHALYRAGAAQALLDRLGVRVQGRVPSSRGLGIRAEQVGLLPFDPVGAVGTTLYTAAERFAFARWVAGLPLARPERLAGRSTADWLGELGPRVGEAAGALVRVSTYSADLDALDAGEAARQLVRALRLVTYLDGGWQSVVDGLVEAADRAGVRRVHTAAREVEGGVVRTDGGTWSGRTVLLCVPPRAAAELTGSAQLTERARTAVPVRAACLDLGLRGEVPPGPRLALGLDRPLYVSVHSEKAALAPSGHSLIHAAVYGGEGQPEALRAELERAVAVVWPDWRDHVVVERWMPRLVVVHDVPGPGRPRQPVAVADRPGVWVAGDWVGAEGLLADAAAASAAEAARAILRSVAERAA